MIDFMDEKSKAAMYLALAQECERLAAEVKTDKERDELLRKAKGYRQLAEQEGDGDESAEKDPPG
jgi:hypothetical protein